MIIYQALFNPMTAESSYYTISSHRTRKGAENAVKISKNKAKKEWEVLANGENGDWYKKHHSWNEFKDWNVREITLQP